MSCKLVSVRIAKIVDLLKESVREKIGDELPIVKPYDLVSVGVVEKKIEVINKTVSVSVDELFLKNKAPRVAVST